MPRAGTFVMSFLQRLTSRRRGKEGEDDEQPHGQTASGASLDVVSSGVASPSHASSTWTRPLPLLSFALLVLLLLADLLTRLLLFPTAPSACSSPSLPSSFPSHPPSPPPTCPLSATFHFAPNGAGLCSHLNTLLGALLLSSLLNRTAFVDDRQWNYGHWHAYFLPLPPHGIPPSVSLPNPAFDHDEAVDEYPVWSLDPPPSVPSVSAFSLSTSFPPPLFSPSPLPSSPACSPPHALLRHRAANLSSPLPLPAHLNLSHADLATPGLYQNPLTQQVRVSAMPPSLPLPLPHPLMLLKRRLLRWLVQPRDEEKERVRQWLQQVGLRPKLTLDEWRERKRGGGGGRQAAGEGRRYIGVHVRRGDKVQSLKMSRNADVGPVYIQAIHHLLNSSLAHLTQPTPPSPSTSPSPLTDACTALGPASPQPDVVLVSDDPAVYSSLPQLAPCFRWHFPFAATGAEAVSRVSGGHDQVVFDSLELGEREALTRDFLCQLLTLVLADYAVVTYSSNVGRLVATLRGWHDSHVERRVRSIDRGWKEY